MADSVSNFSAIRCVVAASCIAGLKQLFKNQASYFDETPKFRAAVAAGSPMGFWRMAGHPALHQALRNAYFDSIGLPRLAAVSKA